MTALALKDVGTSSMTYRNARRICGPLGVFWLNYIARSTPRLNAFSKEGVRFVNKCLLLVPFFFLTILFSGCDSEVSVPENVPPDVEAATVNPTPSPADKNIWVITPAQGDDIDFALYSEEIFCIINGRYGNDAQKYGFMRADGTAITQYIYDYAYPFREGLACVRLEDKFGFIDTDGNTALPFVYDSAAPFSEGLAYFEQGDSYGFMDHTGTPAFLLDVDSVSSFQEGLAFFSIDGKYGYIDRSGHVAIAPIFSDAAFFADGFAKVKVGLTYGLIDKTGAFAVSPIYEDISVSGGYVCVKSDGLYGALRIGGGTILPPEYSFIEILPDHDMAIVGSEEGMKIIGFDGRESKTYDSLSYQQGSDLIEVIDAEKYGFLNINDLSIAVPPRYDYAYYFEGEHAMVRLDGLYGAIDRNGNAVIPIEYEQIAVFSNGTFAVLEGDKYRLVDDAGNGLSDTAYESIWQSGDGYIVRLNELYSFVDAEDHSVTPIGRNTYDERLFGAENCLVVNGSGSGGYGIAVLGEIQDTDLSEFLLRNEITPRIKPYSEFLKDGFFEIMSYEDDTPIQEKVRKYKDFCHFYKLYDMGGGTPVMYYDARPTLNFYFPRSYSGLYSVKNGQLNTLVTGSESGGSMGGDFACFWRDHETLETYIGTYYHYGGWGGLLFGGTVYGYKNGDTDEVTSFQIYQQSSRNYEQSELLENAHLFYDEDGAPYSTDTILQAVEDRQYITEYSVNGVRTTIEEYRQVTERYDRYRPMVLG